VTTVILAEGKERPVLQRHPWIFSGAIARVAGYVGRGDVVEVHAADGSWLARGTWSSGSQIRVRLFSWNEDEPLDEALFRRRIARAIEQRARGGFDRRTGACRLIYAEADGLPGLIVDRYADYLVLQLLTQGIAARAGLIVDLLDEMIRPAGIYERGDAEARVKEGLPQEHVLHRGVMPPVPLDIDDGDRSYQVDLVAGQKTGAYLDQVHNYRRVARYCDDADVLDAFCYTGGFSLTAATRARTILAIDSSEAALSVLQHQAARRQTGCAIDCVAGDVFRELRRLRYEERQFDVVILDPPKFAHSAGQLERATRGYKDINLIAMQLLRPGGVLATYSCSGLVSAELFQKVVFGAAVDARRDVQIVERLAQAPDHPVLLTFPESEYLKGLVCRVWS